MGHETKDYVPRYVLDLSGAGGGECVIRDRRTGNSASIAREPSQIVAQMFALGTTVIEVDTTGSGLGYADMLSEWGGITVVRVRNGHTL